MRRFVLVLSLLVSACAAKQPPIVVPPPAPILTANAFCVAVAVRDPAGAPIAGASVTVGPLSGLSDANGYLYLQPIPAPSAIVSVRKPGYLPATGQVAINSWNCDLQVLLTPVAKPRPTREQVLNIKANFLSTRDEQGRVALDWFYISLDDAGRAAKRARLHAAGLTHLVLCPIAQYGDNPPYAVRDLRGDPTTFLRYLTELLDDQIIPIVFLTSGDGGSAADMQTYWPGLLQALAHEGASIWLVPGFEVVGPGGGWTSKNLSDALELIHAQVPQAALGVHLQPTRATGSSHPLEPDDPWQGDEPSFWTSHGGQYADALLYQTPHGADVLDPNGAHGAFCHLPGADPCGAWEDRFVEILDRVGVGARGWRKVGLSFFEVTGYDWYHGAATSADVDRINSRAAALCAMRQVACTYGNGVPK